MVLLDGLAMTQDTANEQQVGHVPPQTEPRGRSVFSGRASSSSANPGRIHRCQLQRPGRGA